MANSKVVPLSNFLPTGLKGKYEVVDANGKQLKSTGPVFKTGQFPQVNIATLNDASIKQLIKNNHPNIITIKNFEKINKTKK